MHREKGKKFSAFSLPKSIMRGVKRNGPRGISLLLTLQKSQFCSKSQFNERFCPGQVTLAIKQHRTFAPTFVFRLASLLRLLQFELFLLSLCLLLLFGCLQNLLAHFSRLFLPRRGKKNIDLMAPSVGRELYTYYVLLRRGEARGSTRAILWFFSCNCSIVQEASYDVCSRRYSRTGFSDFFYFRSKGSLFLYIFFV